MGILRSPLAKVDEKIEGMPIQFGQATTALAAHIELMERMDFVEVKIPSSSRTSSFF